MHDYFDPKLADEPINVALNSAIERAAVGKAELPRPYLGASIVGSECLRRVQYDWWVTPVLDARTREIFRRGTTWPSPTAKWATTKNQRNRRWRRFGSNPMTFSRTET